MMIYLMRHGIAREPDGQSFEDDRQRPLTTEGSDKIEQIAGRLKKLAVKPDLILSSPYVRAEQTASILAKEFDLQQHLMFSDLLLPAGTADSIVSAIVENYLADELLIVGHEPCLGLLISLLAAANLDLAINIKKGGVCCLSTDDLRVERRATLEWLLTPKILLKG
ncbi:MAG TPA: phosphohistidine phosphatase SixA [Anaerolineales bacterium]